jgi:hypothetical protein
MLLNLKFALALPPLIPRRTTGDLFTFKLPKRPPRSRDALLNSTQLLRACKDTGPARCRTARHRPTRVVHITVERDAAHADLARERNSLCGGRVVAY